MSNLENSCRNRHLQFSESGISRGQAPDYYAEDRFEHGQIAQ